MRERLRAAGPKSLRVLVVEDSEDDARLMMHELRRGGFEPDWERVDTPQGMARALDEKPWDLILSDYRMPHFSAPAALKTLQDKGLDIPFIILSGSIGEDLAVACIKAGAHDYLLKDRGKRLNVAVERAVREAGVRRARRQQDTARRQQQELMARLMETIPSGITVVDRDGRITFANPAAERVLGLTRDNISARTYNDPVWRITDFDGNPFPDEELPFRQIMRTGQPVQDARHAIERPDGTRRYLSIYAAPLASADGELEGMVSSVQDITDSVRAERHIVHLNAVLRSVRNVNQLITKERNRDRLLQRACELLTETRGFVCAWLAVLDEAGNLQAWAEANVGTDFAAMRTQLEQGTPPPCAQRARAEGGIAMMKPDACAGCVFASAYANGRMMTARLIHNDRDRGFMVVALRDDVVVDEQELGLLEEVAGDVAFALHTMDVEQARQASERRVAMLARFPHENPHPVLRVSSHGTVLYGNAASVPLLNAWQCSEGRHLPKAWHEVVRDALDMDKPMTTETRCEERVYDLTFAPVTEEGYVNIYGREITEEQKLERQLRQSEKMQAVGQLAGGVAHEFNNQLAVINGFAELILRKEPVQGSENLHSKVRQMLTAGQRAAELTSQLLAYSRTQEVNAKPLNLNDIIKNLRAMLKRVIGEDVAISLDLAADLGAVEADRGQIADVVINLAANARDAMPEGGDLAIRTFNCEWPAESADDESPPNAGPCVCLGVSDTGVGMDERTRTHIFEPFYTTKPSGKGTGLGLSLVYGVVRERGGTIRVDSEPGQGATFTICLPRAEEIEEESMPAVSNSKDELPTGSETILVVEDEAGVREFIEVCLEEAGYTVLAANNGEEALARIGREQPSIDLVTSDVVMPGIHGFAFVKKLREMYPDVKALYLSGYSHEAVEQRSEAGSDTRVLRKPITAVDLCRAVREVLDG